MTHLPLPPGPHEAAGPSDRDQYLWDRTGTPDPEVVRLESLLEPLRQPDERFQIPPNSAAPRTRHFLARRGTLAALAAAVALGAGMAWYMLNRPRSATWNVETIAGAPAIGARRIADQSGLRIGQWLVTDAASTARVAVPGIGTVTVQPDSRIRVLGSSRTEHRMELDRGGIHAFITAPPRIFLVQTPAAVAVDLGCAYDLSVQEDRSTLLRVTLGWVELERDGNVVKVPRGAACRTELGKPPGIPYFEDASEDFLKALKRWEATQESSTIGQIARSARVRDSLSLWDLMNRLPPGKDRTTIHNSLVDRVPFPPDVSERSILAGDPDSLQRWREEVERAW
jgi:hypothetical protein